MEPPDDYKPVGVPISICMYICDPIRVLDPPTTVIVDENTIKVIPTDTKENTLSVTVDHIVEHDDEHHLNEDVIHPLVGRCVDGVNVSLLCGGSSNTSYNAVYYGTNEGDLPVHEGIIILVLKALLEQLQDNSSVNPFFVRLSYVEMYEESITDLLNSGKKNKLIYDDIKSDFKQATRLGPISSIDNVLLNMNNARKRRNTATTTHGPAADYTSAMCRIYIKQLIEKNKPMLSSFDVVKLPSLNRLAKSSVPVRLTEGPMLNRSLYAFESVCSATATTFPPFDASILTRVLRNALGGDIQTHALLFIAPNDFEGSKGTIRVASMLQAIQNYPLVHTEMLQGILRRNAAESMYLRHELQNSHGKDETAGSDVSTLALVQKTHELEGKILQEGMETLKLKDQIDTQNRTLVEFRMKYHDLVENEIALKKQIMEGEREKLRLSKALVDLQLEQGTTQETIEKEKFDLTTKLLNAENDILELQMREEQHEEQRRAIQENIQQAIQEKKELAIEFVALKANFVTLNGAMQKELAKSQQLSVELLTLVNQKNALQKIVDENERTKHERNASELKLQKDIERISAREQEVAQHLAAEKKQSEELLADKVALEFQLKSATLDAEARLLQYEKVSHDFNQNRYTSEQAFKKQADEVVATMQVKVTSLEDSLQQAESTIRQLNRQVSSLEQALVLRNDEYSSAVKSKEELATLLDVERGEYRSKLVHFMQDSTSTNKDGHESSRQNENLVTQLMESFKRTKLEQEQEIDGLRQEVTGWATRCEALIRVATTFERILEDHNIRHDDIPKDIAAWSRELANRTQDSSAEMQALRLKLEKAHQELSLQVEKNLHIAETYKEKLREVEKTKESVQCQLEICQRETDRLRQELQSSSKSDSHGSDLMKQMQETLLKQIQELRTVYTHPNEKGQDLHHHIQKLEIENATLTSQLQELQGSKPEKSSRRPSQMNHIQAALEDSERRCLESTTKSIMLTEEIKQLKQLLQTTKSKYEKRIRDLEAEYH